MNADRVKQIRELYERVRYLPEDQRRMVLEQAGADDPELRREVEARLKGDEDTQELAPLTDLQAPSSDFELWGSGNLEDAMLAAEEIGHYRIIQKLGAGGMGAVYLAEQRQPLRRRVALKVIKLGMDTQEVIARFESERQALALMDHPNVAKVFDAGTTERGRPYFVMEYVQGEPITDYCDRQCLTTDERLHLFIEVCHAVQHAHQKEIIHRDIKPSNLLVTLLDGKPTPKVIDFGVAKAIGQKLTERTLTTKVDQLIGTPEYMAPEQADATAIDVDTRTDIYSLGVSLYELLVGALPFDSKTLRAATTGEMVRILREVDPPKPSTKFTSLGNEGSEIAANHRGTDHRHLMRELRGDLDWIVMKAIDKDRQRRYGDCEELADDIRRHLDNVPVLAGPPSWTYRTRKFIRRRRRPLAVAATLAVLTALTGYSVVWGLQSSSAKWCAEADLHARDWPKEALKLYDKALWYWPFVKAKIGRAYALRWANRDAEAEAACRRIIEHHPDAAAPAHVLLAQLLHDRNPREAQKHLNHASATAGPDEYDYSRALALGPEDAVQAIELLTKVLKHEPSNYEARWARAWRYFDTHDYESMLQDADRLTDSLPETATYWNAKGMAYTGLRESSKAIQAFNTAIRLRSENPYVYLNRAHCYLQKGDLSQALADCNRAINVLRLVDDAKAFALRAMVRTREFNLRRGHQQIDLEPALKDCQKALSLEPENLLAWRSCGEVRYERREYPEALAALEKGLRKDKGNEYDYQYRAILRRKDGRIAEALEDHDRAISFRPGWGEAFAARSTTRRFAQDLDGALVDLEQAMEISDAWKCQADLWIWEIHMLRDGPGERAAAESALAQAAENAPVAAAAFSRREAKALSDLYVKIVGVCQGQVDEDEILAHAYKNAQVTDDEITRRTAHYYLGVRDLLDGRQEEAAVHFRACRDQGLEDFPEVELARWHLERLGAPTTASAGALLGGRMQIKAEPAKRERNRP